MTKPYLRPPSLPRCNTSDRLFRIMCSLSANIETFEMGPFTVPRIWNGLWQLSSNAWGTTSSSQICVAMERYSKIGYVAYGTYHPRVQDVFMVIFFSDMVMYILFGWTSVIDIRVHSDFQLLSRVRTCNFLCLTPQSKNYL